MPAKKKAVGHGRLLLEQPFRAMYSDFASWRIDDFIRLIEKERRAGRVLPFVRGLRLSSHLIYAIRTILNGSGMTANWGHLLDDDRVYCSRECDVIIHDEGCLMEWNGHGDRSVMNFKFIEKHKVKVVISCKHYLRTSEIDTDYCEDIKLYTKNIWLFAECCGPKSATAIDTKAKNAGYKKFFYLYNWSRGKSMTQPNEKGWIDFVSQIEKLK